MSSKWNCKNVLWLVGCRFQPRALVLYCDMKWIYSWWHNNSLTLHIKQSFVLALIKDLFLSFQQNPSHKKWNLNARIDKRAKMTSKDHSKNAPIIIKTQCCIPVLRKCDHHELFSKKHKLKYQLNKLTIKLSVLFYYMYNQSNIDYRQNMHKAQRVWKLCQQRVQINKSSL